MSLSIAYTGLLATRALNVFSLAGFTNAFANVLVNSSTTLSNLSLVFASSLLVSIFLNFLGTGSSLISSVIIFAYLLLSNSSSIIAAFTSVTCSFLISTLFCSVFIARSTLSNDSYNASTLSCCNATNPITLSIFLRILFSTSTSLAIILSNALPVAATSRSALCSFPTFLPSLLRRLDNARLSLANVLFSALSTAFMPALSFSRFSNSLYNESNALPNPAYVCSSTSALFLGGSVPSVGCSGVSSTVVGTFTSSSTTCCFTAVVASKSLTCFSVSACLSSGSNAFNSALVSLNSCL